MNFSICMGTFLKVSFCKNRCMSWNIPRDVGAMTINIAGSVDRCTPGNISGEASEALFLVCSLSALSVWLFRSCYHISLCGPPPLNVTTISVNVTWFMIRSLHLWPWLADPLISDCAFPSLCSQHFWLRPTSFLMSFDFWPCLLISYWGSSPLTMPQPLSQCPPISFTITLYWNSCKKQVQWLGEQHLKSN